MRDADEVWLISVVLEVEEVGAGGAVVVETAEPSAEAAGTTSVVTGPVNEVTKPEDVLALLLLLLLKVVEEEDELGVELAVSLALVLELELGVLAAESLDEDDCDVGDAEEKEDEEEGDDDADENEDEGDGVALTETEDELEAPTVTVDMLDEEWLAVRVEGTGIAEESLEMGELNEPFMELMVKNVEYSWYTVPSTGLIEVKLM